MRRKRERKILITKEENRLISKSTVIDSYSNIKAILNKYANLYEKDMENNDDFDDKLKNLILYVFKDIVDEAVGEWYGHGEMSLAKSEEVFCSLCGRKNIYIYYIKNRFNNVILNVGSDCIDKFPKLKTGLPEGMTAKQFTSRRVRELKRLERLEDFNRHFPNVKEMLSSWYKDYNSLPIIMPTNIHNETISIHNEANKIFEDYINESISGHKLDRFTALINERNSLKLQFQEFINQNKKEKFICTKQIYNWISKEYKDDAERIIELVRNNNSILHDSIIHLIYEEKFLKSILDDFKNMQSETRISITKLEDNNIYFKFKDKVKRLEIELYTTKKEFMKRYGIKLKEKDPIIEENDIFERLKVVFDKNNYAIMVDKLEQILQGTKYEVDLNYDSMKKGLEFIDKYKGIFASGLDAEIFFNAQKRVILLEKENTKDFICSVIAKINNWRPLSDKEKYDIGDISKR